MNFEMLPIRVAPKAVIVENGRLFTVHMQGSKGGYYMFPGGGNETPRIGGQPIRGDWGSS